MMIERAYVDEPDKWSPVDVDTFLLRTEWAGVYPKGSALQALTEQDVLRTPAYLFRMKGKHQVKEIIMSRKNRIEETEKPVEQNEQAEVGDSLEEQPVDTTLDQKADADEKDAKADATLAGPAPEAEDGPAPESVATPESGRVSAATPNQAQPPKEKPAPKPRGFPLGTIRHYKNGEAFRRVEPPKGWEYLGKTGSAKVLSAEDEAKAQGLEVIYDQQPAAPVEAPKAE